jgi:UDP-2,3-diacylglucosamine pyrophosphatase LpxH
MQHSKWLAKMGAVGYDALILINRMVNFISDKFGKGKISFSKRIKNSVKSAVAFINKFEHTVCDIATANKYSYVICGHIHEPCMKTMVTEHGTVRYLNSGDWIENLTALEYHNAEWKLYRYHDDPVAQSVVLKSNQIRKQSSKELFDTLLAEMKMTSK